MTTTDIEKQENLTVSYDENILNFLDYTIIMLSQAKSAADIDIIMDDFLSDDFIDLVVENKQLFSILSVVWIDVFKRVFIESDESSFSLKTLWIPVLFHKLDWIIEDKSVLSDLHTICLKKANKEKTVYDYLVLLFVEGIFSSLEFAFDNFKKNVYAIATTDDDIKDLDNLFWDITSLGWPQSTTQQPSNQAKWKFEVSSH